MNTIIMMTYMHRSLNMKLTANFMRSDMFLILIHIVESLYSNLNLSIKDTWISPTIYVLTIRYIQCK